MTVKFEDLKVGTVIEHDLGFIGEVLSIDSPNEIDVKVIYQGTSRYSVGYERNCFVDRMVKIISQPEADEAFDSYEVEMELPTGIIIRMDYVHFEKFTKHIKTI